MTRGTVTDSATATYNVGVAERAFVQTSDLDETRDAMARHFYSNFIDMLRPSARLDTRMHVVRFGPLTVGDIGFGADLRLRFGELGAYHVDLPLTGRLAWRQGNGETMVSAEQEGAIFLPSGDTVLDRWSDDCRILAIKIERRALERQLARMLDAPVTAPIRFNRRMDVTNGAGRTWARLARVLSADAAEAGGLANHPLIGDRLHETLLSGLLLSVDHQYRERLDNAGQQPNPTPRSVRRAMEAMQAHPEEPFTMARLAEIAGVSQRSLQKGFQRYAGTSPMSYLRDIRLGRVHDELRRVEPTEATVAEVALRWGFAHLGRFAGAYRARYGEPPSRTLRMKS